jgi:glyoxylase-like metal-dependent hydrolase (beta-lactamase superfamily II)
MKTSAMCGVLLGMMAAGSPNVFAQQTQITTRKVGEIEVNLIAEGIRRGNPPRFVNADEAVIKQYIPDGTVDSEVNMFALKTKEGVVIIDAGYGAGLPEGLKNLGIEAKDVVAILLTHTHGDHVGGLLKDGKAAFTKAALYISAKELEFWNKGRGGEYTKAYGKVIAFEPAELGTRGTPLFTGITPFAAYGHTPGHSVYLLESGGQKLLIAGDLINVGDVQFPRPDIATAYDSDAAQAAASRKRVLEYAAKSGIQFSGMHLVFPAFGTVSQSGAGFMFAKK